MKIARNQLDRAGKAGDLFALAGKVRRIPPADHRFVAQPRTGVATGRQFHRAFVLADGMDVIDATLTNGLLVINLRRPEPNGLVRRIEIKE